MEVEDAKNIYEEVESILCFNDVIGENQDIAIKEISIYIIEQLIDERHYTTDARKPYLIKVKAELNKL